MEVIWDHRRGFSSGVAVRALAVKRSGPTWTCTWGSAAGWRYQAGRRGGPRPRAPTRERGPHQVAVAVAAVDEGGAVELAGAAAAGGQQQGVDAGAPLVAVGAGAVQVGAGGGGETARGGGGGG